MAQIKKINNDKVGATPQTPIVISAHESQHSYSYIPPSKTHTTSKTHNAIVSYAYVKQDMQKTFLITSILLFASLLLYVLIATRVIELSAFGY